MPTSNVKSRVTALVASTLMTLSCAANAAAAIENERDATARPSGPPDDARPLPAPAMRVVPGLEEPLIAIGKTSARMDVDLSAAIARFRAPSATAVDFPEQAEPFVQF